MSKQLYSFILLIFAFKLILKAQPNVKIYNQQTDSGFVIIADNYEVYPISVELEFKVKI
jgi:hypothetical protein